MIFRENVFIMFNTINTEAKFQEIEVYYCSLKKTHLQTHVW